jgi:hypothetical protein
MVAENRFFLQANDKQFQPRSTVFRQPLGMFLDAITFGVHGK